MTATVLPAMSEDDFLHRVIDTARLHGWLVAHFRPARKANGKWRTPMTGDPGFPDLVLVKNGRMLLVELKSNTGTVSPQQRRWHDALGSWVQVWRPRDWPVAYAQLVA